MSTQPYKSPDLQKTDAPADRELEPVAKDEAERLKSGPSQTAGAKVADKPTSAEIEHSVQEDKQEELDDALDDSFPASDPPAQTTKGRAR